MIDREELMINLLNTIHLEISNGWERKKGEQNLITILNNIPIIDRLGGLQVMRDHQSYIERNVKWEDISDNCDIVTGVKMSDWHDQEIYKIIYQSGYKICSAVDPIYEIRQIIKENMLEQTIKLFPETRRILELYDNKDSQLVDVISNVL